MEVPWELHSTEARLIALRLLNALLLGSLPDLFLGGSCAVDGLIQRPVGVGAERLRLKSAPR